MAGYTTKTSWGAPDITFCPDCGFVLAKCKCPPECMARLDEVLGRCTGEWCISNRRCALIP